MYPVTSSKITLSKAVLEIVTIPEKGEVRIITHWYVAKADEKSYPAESLRSPGYRYPIVRDLINRLLDFVNGTDFAFLDELIQRAATPTRESQLSESQSTIKEGSLVKLLRQTDPHTQGTYIRPVGAVGRVKFIQQTATGKWALVAWRRRGQAVTPLVDLEPVPAAVAKV